MKNNDIQTLIQKYFLQWLMAQRNVSPETIKSYRDTFRLYLRYIETHCGVTPAKISITQFDADHILGFLTWTRNGETVQRLSTAGSLRYIVSSST